MDLTILQNIQGLFKNGLPPSKRLGQHFLIDQAVLSKIIKAADLGPNDTILEIGPGTGILTRELAQRVKRVIAVEKDEKMANILKETLKDSKNVEIIRGDILKIDPSPYLLTPNYKVVANLPYYITSPVIRKFLETQARPMSMTLMVQKEVAQRICAKPPRMSLLAVSVQFYAKPETISFVPKTSFWPQPEVDSAIIRITPTQRKQLWRRNLHSFEEQFFHIIKAGFSHSRKQLINNLSTELLRGRSEDREEIKKWLSENNIQPTQRAETLTVENWISLSKTFKTFVFIT